MPGRFEVQAPPVVALIGEVDMGTVTGLQDALERVGREHGHVIVDLSETTFLDSTAMAALLLAHSRGARVVLRNAHGEPRRLLDICGALEVLEVED